MIIDWYHDFSTTDERPCLYIRTRDEQGVLTERTISPDDEDWQAPFCWVSQNIAPWKMKQILNRTEGSFFHKNQTATGIDGEPLWKLTVEKPNDLWDIKQSYPKVTYEADVQYVDQVLLSLYPDKLPKFKPRIWYFDLEWDPEDDFTTIMAVDDNFADHPVVFAWSEERAKLKLEGKPCEETKWIDREDGYELRLFGSEDDMHESFLQHLEACDPDILTAHAMMWADLPHLLRRLADPDRLSPINRVLPPPKKAGFYKTTRQPIKGRLCFDTAATKEEGSGFEGVWQKAGKGQMVSRKLDWVATELGFGGKLTNEYPEMTVFNGWYEYFDAFVDYCLRDTTLLRKCDEKLNCINFHIALQQLCGVAFFSTHNVSRYFRGLMGRRTNDKALSSYSQEREALKAAWVMPAIPGRHEEVALLDFASLYPNIILSNNLCYTTKRNAPGEGILSLGNGTHWDQTKKGLLPSVVEEMLTLRKEYKQLLKEAKTDDEKLGYNMLQAAVKVAVNAIYGMTGSRRLGGAWSDFDIARSITYKGREAISMLVSESEKLGFKSLAGHTDSVYVNVPFDKARELSNHLTNISKNQLDMQYLDVEWEAYFPYWVATGTNKNFGIKSYPPEDVGVMKVTGFELKAANASPLTKRVQEAAFNLIATGEDEEAVYNAVRPIVKSVFDNTIPLRDITTHTRLNREFKDYVSPGLGVKAAKYYNEHIGMGKEDFRKGESVSWIFIKGVPEGKPMIPQIAYRNEKELDDYSIDWHKSVDKMVTMKLTRLYEMLGWDLDNLVAFHRPKKYW